MKLSDLGELSLLRQIRERFKAGASDLIAGIGDDAAAVVPRDRILLLTTDAMAEGTHFDLGFTTFFQLGFKIVSVNVSDIYAMGGNPRFVLLTVAAKSDTDERCIKEFFDGVQKAMSVYHLKLIGGDLSAAGSVVVSATLMGYVRKPVMRSGARPGDRIYVTGNLGDSACGLELLKRIRRPVAVESGDKINAPLGWQTMQPLIRRHLLPEARDPRKIAGLATAMIDVSDGLFIDLSRLCDESGVGAEIHARQLPISPQMKRAADALGLDPYGLASSGGEDYELLFTAPARRKVDAFCIGEVTESERIFIDSGGVKRPLSSGGYEHWR